MKRPIIYEIHAWLWLEELRNQYGKGLHLGTIPEEVWDDLTSWGMDALWMMGVWKRSVWGQTLLEGVEGVRATMERLFPHEQRRILASPYCVQSYEVDEHLGGWAGLEGARSALADRGVKLILDFVPNHTAPDHPWVLNHPEFYLLARDGNPKVSKEAVIECEGRAIARGRDPFFPPWPDVVQLNAFHEGYRQAAIAELTKIAAYCDGVRCDMAMLLLTEIFAQTWQGWVTERPAREYWDEVIVGVRERYPEFLFLAEVYWGYEGTLMQLGFDFCYDKVLYDLLIRRDLRALRRHLEQEAAYQDRLCRFMENHDEARAAAVFVGGQLAAAALTTFTTPGAHLFHEGQFQGKKIYVPVYAPARPMEPRDLAQEGFWRWLIGLMNKPLLKEGTWQLMPPFKVWPDNVSGARLFAWLWSHDETRLLVVLNYAETSSQGLLPLSLREEAYGREITLTDLSTGIIYQRVTQELNEAGLYVDLPPWGYHVFRFCTRIR